MKLKPTRMVITAILVAGIGFSVYLWAALLGGEPREDAEISAMRQAYTCPGCKATFSLSIAEAAQMRRQHGGILCPECGKAESEQKDVQVWVSGGPSTTPDSEPETGHGADAIDRPPPAVMTRQPNTKP